MTAFDPKPNETLREARRRYFEVNRFGANGGYDDPFVEITFGPFKVPIPNTKGRVRAVRFHDLHHILTGYDTDLRGEAEIGAWEIGSGCADHYAAWVLNFGAMSVGALLIPKRTWQAFRRGLKSKNLYRETFDEALLERKVSEMRTSLGLDDCATPDATMHASSSTAA